MSIRRNNNDDLVWKALADPVRREILDLLAAAPRRTGDLVAHFDLLCRTAVMKHVTVLERAGLVNAVRSGRTRWNHLNPVPLEGVCARWLNPHTRAMASAITRLKDLSEAPTDDFVKSIRKLDKQLKPASGNEQLTKENRLERK